MICGPFVPASNSSTAPVVHSTRIEGGVRRLWTSTLTTQAGLTARALWLVSWSATNLRAARGAQRHGADAAAAQRQRSGSHRALAERPAKKSKPMWTLLR